MTDASGGASVEAHERAVQRMVQAGAVPLTWMAFLSELQRDWARNATAEGTAQIVIEHGGAAGISFGWEMQLLGKAG